MQKHLILLKDTTYVCAQSGFFFSNLKGVEGSLGKRVSEIKIKTSRLQDESSTNCTESSFLCWVLFETNRIQSDFSYC